LNLAYGAIGLRRYQILFALTVAIAAVGLLIGVPGLIGLYWRLVEIVKLAVEWASTCDVTPAKAP
jgi:hypothetical protein